MEESTTQGRSHERALETGAKRPSLFLFVVETEYLTPKLGQGRFISYRLEVSYCAGSKGRWHGGLLFIVGCKEQTGKRVRHTCFSLILVSWLRPGQVKHHSTNPSANRQRTNQNARFDCVYGCMRLAAEPQEHKGRHQGNRGWIWMSRHGLTKQELVVCVIDFGL